METIIIIAIFIGFFAFVGGIVFLVYYFSKNSVIKRNLKKIPAKKISQFLNGDIGKIVGKIEFIGEPLIAPLSKRPCAYYHIYVEQHQGGGKNSRWIKLVEEEVAGKFLIRDGSHFAVIDCNQIKTYLVQDKTFQSGFMNDASSPLNEFLSQRGHTSVNFLGLNKSIRYNEGILESGELVAVAGKAEWKEARDLELPESYGRVLEIKQTAEQQVYLSDDPKTVKVEYSNDTYTTR